MASSIHQGDHLKSARCLGKCKRRPKRVIPGGDDVSGIGEEVGLEGDVGVENDGGLDGGVDDGVVHCLENVDSASSSVDVSRKAGFGRSIETLACRPEASTRKNFSARLSTGKGPSYRAGSVVATHRNE